MGQEKISVSFISTIRLANTTIFFLCAHFEMQRVTVYEYSEMRQSMNKRLIKFHGKTRSDGKFVLFWNSRTKKTLSWTIYKCFCSNNLLRNLSHSLNLNQWDSHWFRFIEHVKIDGAIRLCKKCLNICFDFLLKVLYIYIKKLFVFFVLWVKKCILLGIKYRSESGLKDSSSRTTSSQVQKLHREKCIGWF